MLAAGSKNTHETEEIMRTILDGPYRNPLRLEIGRHVVPLAMAILFLGVALGYAWARAAYQYMR